MSELIKQNRGTFRWHLLTTVSALSLTVTLSASADASDKPSVWIELGGQLERIDGREDAYLPPFTTLSPTPSPYREISPSEAQKASIYSYGAEGKISIQPEGSKWEFSAGLRYGRSGNKKHTHQQTVFSTVYPNTKYHGTPGVAPFKTNTAPAFADFRIKNNESHAILDFQVGRDVGLGMFTSTASFGVRMVNFTSKASANIIARPIVGFHPAPIGGGKYFQTEYHTDYKALSENERSFKGVGPSVSWTGDARVFGNEDGAVTFNWGVNAALLFGRQKARGSHQESAYYYPNGFQTIFVPPYAALVYDHPPKTHNRARNVVVPNIGGLAGISFRYPGTKISFGYRADFFLGAMDMGIDARHTVSRNFYGPFATIAVGL